MSLFSTHRWLPRVLVRCACAFGVAAALFGSAVNAGDVIYEYDAAGRLKRVVYPDNTSKRYTLDPAGNRTQVQAAVVSGGTIAFSSNSYSVGEQIGTVQLTVTRSGGLEGQVGVSYRSVDGSAGSVSDYGAVNGTLTWAHGDAEPKTIDVQIVDDAIPESTEQFTVRLENPTGGAALGVANEIEATVTITDNDVYPTISIASQSANEDTGVVNFVVSLSPASGGTYAVNYITANGTAIAGSDYTAASGQLVFSPGEIGKTISVPVVPDQVYEFDETFTVTLSAPTNGAMLGTSTAVGTILNDDDAPKFSISDAFAFERLEGNTPMRFTVTKEGITSMPHSVQYGTMNGSAVAPDDYVAISSLMLTFAPEETSKTFNISIVGDLIIEGVEFFNAVIFSPSNGATIEDGIGVGTIYPPDLVNPTPPTGLTAAFASLTQVNLSWNASTDTGGSGVAGYYINRDGAFLATSTATSFTDSTVVNGTGHSYTVIARDGASNVSSPAGPVVPTDIFSPTPPTSLSAVAVSSTQINLSWTASTDVGSSGVASYRIERCAGAGCSSFAEIGSISSASYSDTTASGMTTYQYRVRARDGAGNYGGYSNIATAVTLDTIAPTTPSGLGAAAASSTSVNLSWTASTDSGGSGLAGYRIERCTGFGCSGFVEVGSSPSASYNDTTVSGLTIYQYRVSARDGAGNNSGYSNIASVVTPDTIAPTTPASLSASSPNSSAVNLSWSASTDTGGSGLASYRVERCSGAGCSSFAEIGSATSASYSDTTVSGTSTYQYRVRARDGSGNDSGYSNIATVTTPDSIPPSAPGELSATAQSSNQVFLRWSAASDSGGSGVAAYHIDRCVGYNCNNYSEIASVGSSAITYYDTSVSGTTTYNYRVRARDQAGNYGPYANYVMAVTPDTIAPTAPSGLIVTSVTENSVSLSWSPATDSGGSGLFSYRVYRNGQSVGGSSASSTSFTDSSAISQNTYSYYVTARDGALNESAASNTVQVTTPGPVVPDTPTGLFASAPTSTGNVTFSWNAVSGATYYELWENTLGLRYSGASTGTTLGVTIGIWRYRVRACNGSGCGAFSTTITVRHDCSPISCL